MDARSAISVQGLTRTFGEFVAVDHIDFTVAKGEIFGFLGPNGSGKSTTIRMLCGLLPVTGGEAEVLGIDVRRDPEAVKRRIGYMSQRFSLYDDLTVDDNLEFFGGVYGVKGKRFAERRDFVLELADLKDRGRELTANLSVGWKQRLALGCAIIHEPPLVFLDEPTGGVDPLARRHFWDLLYDMSHAGTTLFVTTHYMDEAEYCNTLGFMSDGKLIALGSPAGIKSGMRRQVWRIEGSPLDHLYSEVAAADGCRDAVIAGSGVHMTCDLGLDPSGEVRLRADKVGVEIASIERATPTMEDVFISMAEQER